MHANNNTKQAARLRKEAIANGTFGAFDSQTGGWVGGWVGRPASALHLCLLLEWVD